MQGIGGDVWSLVPVVGGPVARRTPPRQRPRRAHRRGRDRRATPAAGQRRRGDASSATVDVDLDDAGDGDRRRRRRPVIDLDCRRSSSWPRSTTPAVGIGDRLADARDEAGRRRRPARADGPPRPSRCSTQLPEVLGATASGTYLVALLNPAEQRFSGGAPLTVAPMTVDRTARLIDRRGRRHRRPRPLPAEPRYWKKVEGNPFHRRARCACRTATFAPDWSVSGEELLRGWAQLRGQEADGLIAIDVVALAELLAVSPARSTCRGYGTLDASTTSSRSWSATTTPSPTTTPRQALNRALVPALRRPLLRPGQAVDKVASLRESARARHFALYMRDPDVQAAVTDLGLAGEPVRHRARLPRRLHPEHQRAASPTTGSDAAVGSDVTAPPGRLARRSG